MDTSQEKTAYQRESQQEHVFDENPHPHIHLMEDGSFRWTYDLNMRKRPHLLVLIMKMILFPLAILLAGLLLYSLSSGVPLLNVIKDLWIMEGVIALIVVIIVFSYFLTAKVMGDDNAAAYEMNDYGIRLISSENAMVRDMRKSADVSAFHTVKTIRIDREHNLIALNSWFLYNLVYCEPEDFDFVARYITERCTHGLLLKR